MAPFDIHWIRPYWLWLLPIVWLLLIMVWRQHRAGGDWAKVTDPHLLKFLSGNQTQQGKFTRHGFKLLIAGCLSLALVALAGPAWEKSATGSFSANYARVMVLDLSRSMLAEDIKPSRSAQAQFKLIDLLDQIEEGQVGLVAFAGQAFVIAPLSSDMETIKNLVPALTPNIMPVLGSRPGEALLLAADLIRQAGFSSGEIILLADSSNSQALKVAENLADEGFSISVLGVGTAQGAPIPSGRGFTKDSSGQIVVSKLEIGSLQNLANAGNGDFYLLRADNSELTQLLTKTNNDFVATDGADSALDTRWLDQGYWLLLLLLPLSLMLFRKGWIFILPLFILPYWTAPLQAQESEPQLATPSAELPIEATQAGNKFWSQLWHNRDQRAEIDLQNKNYEQLLQESPSARFRAEGLYRNGEYSEAAEIWQQLEQAQTDPLQQAAAAYNTGNALAAQNELDAAISAYERSLKLNPENEDAKANLEILKQLKEQQNQEGGEQDSEDQEKEQQQDQEQENQQQQDEQEQNQEDESASEEDQPAEPEEEQTEPEQEEQAEPEQQQEEEPAELTQEEQWTEEDEQAKEQWLRRIPDDPGGLLRRKLNQEYQRRNRHAEKNQPW